MAATAGGRAGTASACGSGPGRFVPAIYDLDVNLDPVSGTVTGSSQVEYTNNQAVPLPELYLHLYPNAAVFSQDVRRPDGWR